ncbi:hypothetical protein CBOM_03101 [Ceraceosorus bombacis]|uniref:Uncharacterized protein n=1 Tax=Ceraceosorus bombacis TaxID=401625 RepID=A0A0P1BN16_9BASI|nr:hypothetical protein CBOM_03101 [Ceraceosorus bombacis]
MLRHITCSTKVRSKDLSKHRRSSAIQRSASACFQNFPAAGSQSRSELRIGLPVEERGYRSRRKQCQKQRFSTGRVAWYI